MGQSMSRRALLQGSLLADAALLSMGQQLLLH